METDNFDVEITFYSATVAAYIKRECKKKKKKKKRMQSKRKRNTLVLPQNFT